MKRVIVLAIVCSMVTTMPVMAASYRNNWFSFFWKAPVSADIDNEVSAEDEETSEVPVITSATQSGTTKSGKIKICWDKVKGAVNYHIQISKYKGFSELYRDNNSVKNNYYNTGWNFYNNIGSGQKLPVYYCRVKAIMQDGTESGWSSVTACTYESE